MKIERITNSRGSEAQKLIDLHSKTFPEYERFQGTSLMADLIDNASSMHFNAIHEGENVVGFFIYWDLGDFYYIHFIAVYPDMRNMRTGQRVMEWVDKNMTKPVLLESEVPFDEISARRLNFYKRNHFQELANDPATLSEVRKGGHPLWLMGTQPVADLKSCLIKIRDKVYFGTGE